MKKIILSLLIFVSFSVFAQEKIGNLKYARTEIKVPNNCVAKSEYEIVDCNGFSVQWLFLNDEMVKQKVNEQLFNQIEQQLDYKTKKKIKFTSQNQQFEGVKYKMKDGTVRIIGFGKVDEIPLILNLGFDKEPNNNELSDFEKKFINFN